MKENLSTELFSIDFPCRVGLGAGFDRDARKIKHSLRTRYGFIEIGPVTLYQQPATYRSRQIKHTFQPNRGVKHVIHSIQAVYRRRKGPSLWVALAYGNGCQDVDSIVAEYETLYSLIYDFADAFTIDTSAQGANGTHPLQDDSVLSDILDSLLDIRSTYDSYKPLIIKVSPNISTEILQHILDYSRLNGVDAIMVKVTDIKAIDKAAAMIRSIREYTLDRYPILCDCGQLSPAAINAAMEAGAQLVCGRRMAFVGFGRIKRLLSRRAAAMAAATEPAAVPAADNAVQQGGQV